MSRRESRFSHRLYRLFHIKIFLHFACMKMNALCHQPMNELGQHLDYKLIKNKVQVDSCTHVFHFIHSSLSSSVQIIILLTTNIPCLLRLFSKFEELPDRLSMELECVHWDRRDWGWEGSFRDKPPTSMQFTFMFGFSPAVYTDKVLTCAIHFRGPQ